MEGQLEGIIVPGQEPETTQEPQTPNYEEIARAKGWVPKEQFDGDETTYVSAEEFIKREPLLERIKGQRKKIKELELAVQGMAKHYTANIEAAKRKAIADLSNERMEAISVGDVAKVQKIEQEINSVVSVSTPEVPTVSLAPEIEDFISKHNSWWGKNIDMTDEAVAINEAYLKRNPGKLAESLAYTEEKIKALYPDVFKDKQRKPTIPDVEGDVGIKGNNKYSTNMLTKEQKAAYNQYVKIHKIMTHDEYFKSLEEVGFLGDK